MFASTQLQSNSAHTNIDYFRILTAAYKAVNETKTAADINFLLTKYAGYEDELVDTVCNKYHLDKNGLVSADQKRSRYGQFLQSALGSQTSGAVDGSTTEQTTRFSSPFPPHHNNTSSVGSSTLLQANNEHTNTMTAEEFAKKQMEMTKLIEAAKARLAAQQVQISEMISERSSIKQKQTEVGKRQHDEIAVITHTLAAMKIELLRLESHSLEGYVTLAEFQSERRATEKTTARLAEVLKLRRVLERAMKDYLALHPTDTAVRSQLRMWDPAMASRLETL